MSIRSLVLASVATLAFSAGAYASTFNLAGANGDSPTFSVTSGGNTATFTSPAGNFFSVQPVSGLFSFNGGYGLVDLNFSPDTLTISFATPITYDLTFQYGFVDPYGTGDVLTATTNTNQVFNLTSANDGLAEGFPEGTASLALTSPVTSITLTGTEAFAIGNVTTVTPEPTSIALLATGLAGIVMRRRRSA